MAAPREFKINRLLDLVDRGKYEVTDAGFAAIDRYERLPVAKKMQNRKIAVQVMDLLQSDVIKYYYAEHIRQIVTTQERTKDATAQIKAMPSGDDAPPIEAPGEPAEPAAAQAAAAPAADDSSGEEE